MSRPQSGWQWWKCHRCGYRTAQPTRVQEIEHPCTRAAGAKPGTVVLQPLRKDGIVP